MDDTPEALAEIEQLNASFPATPALKVWKEQGKKIIAFECTYVPEEIIYASGALPIRLIGDSRLANYDDANACMYPNTCSFIRNCLEMVLKDRYRFLDGFVAGSTCDCSRRLADVWEHYGFTPFIHTVGVPRKINDGAYQLYAVELRQLVSRLEAFMGASITHEALQESIRLYNRRRELLKSLYQMTKADNPPIAGSELLTILNASVSLPPEQFNAVTQRLIKELSTGRRKIAGRFRIMVAGSPLNNPDFIRAIEQMGGLVVIDELCTGVRYWWEGVDFDSDPIKAICRRYLHNFACPRMEPSDDRLQRILRLVRDFRVQGFITQMVRYCVPQTMEQPMVREMLEAQGLPVLELDVEYGMGGTGQITTRLQAFFEMLQGRSGR
ncbi:MAG: 2-hydroxyglutaryl-CoA dehydratase, D-component [Chloroflexi bacterium]|nr:2-hydroxyglutaryl-CoA dehydratase, D-component [Chloroflexota bacterium]